MVFFLFAAFAVASASTHDVCKNSLIVYTQAEVLPESSSSMPFDNPGISVLRVFSAIKSFDPKTADERGASMVHALNGILLRHVRLGWNPIAVQRAQKFKRAFEIWLNQKLVDATDAEFREIVQWIAHDIETDPSPIILNAWFSTNRSLQAPELLIRLVENRDPRQVGRLAVQLALVHPHWCNTLGIELVIQLLSNLDVYYQSPMSGPGSVIDEIGLVLFTLPQWRQALSENVNLAETYDATLNRYLTKAASQFMRDASEFVHTWLANLKDDELLDRKIEMVRKYSSKQVYHAIYSVPQLRDSHLFWPTTEKLVQSQYGIDIIIGELKSETSGLRTSHRAPELIRFLLERSQGSIPSPDAYPSIRYLTIELAKTMSSGYWLSQPIAAQVMDTLINVSWRGFISRLTEVTDHWPNQTMRIVSAWAGHPSGPRYLTEAIQQYSIYYRVRTIGGNMTDLVYDEVTSSPRATAWLTNPAISELLVFWLRDSTFYVRKLLDRPEIQQQPNYSLWQQAAQIEDREERRSYLAAATKMN